MKLQIKWYYKLIFSLLLLVLMVWQYDFTSVLDQIFTISYSYFLLSLFFGLMNVLISSMRLKSIYKIYNEELYFHDLLKIYLKGNFYNNFLPSQIGGDVYKVFAIKKLLKNSDDESTAIATFGVFMDRFSGLIILFFIGLIGLYLNFGLIGLVSAVFILVIGIIGYFFSLKYLRSKIKIIDKFDKAGRVFFMNKRIAIKIFLSALLIQIVAILSIYFAFISIGSTASLTNFILYVPIITIIGVLPISFNGLGLQDYTYIGIFTNVIKVMSEEVAFAGSIMTHFSRFLLSLIGGLIVILDNFKQDNNDKANN